MANKKLSDLRKEIDKLDERIVELICKRGKVGCSIGENKKKKKQPVYSPEREREVYERVVKNNKGPFSDSMIKGIYREVMSACIALEQPITIAYMGPESTFTHQASLKKFGISVGYLECPGISDVFSEVERGNADYGVVPIENSTEGAINHTLDMFVDSSLVICSEIYFPIKHSLLFKGKSLSSVKNIYSNPYVFGQCRVWLEKNVPLAKLVDVVSTIRAAEVASKQTGSACIASELAAKKYKLNVLARSIEDSSKNVTRFLVIGKQLPGVSGADKTSIMFSVKDRPGILHDMLNSFKKYNINLTKIESRPSKKKMWKYYFFVDLDGHIGNLKVKKVLKDLEKRCYFLKILGSYPKAR